MKKIRDDFDWGDFISQKHMLLDELHKYNIYERYQSVKEGDVVVDIGASVGVFTESIIRKNPKHVYCLEPWPDHFQILKQNMSIYPNVTCIPLGISYHNGINICEKAITFERNIPMECITFDFFKNIFDIANIDFLKSDCECGEYSFLTKDNINDKTIKYISSEMHLAYPEYKLHFKYFRDSVLKYHNRFKVTSINGVDIKGNLYDPLFIYYFNEVHLYIDNT